MKLSDYAVDHPVPVTVFVAVAALFGVLALGALTQSLFPDFDKPTVNVSVTYPGVAPEEIERQVTRLLEDELSKIPGVQKITSRSLPSRAVVNVEFDWSVDVDAKLVDIRERLTSVRSRLPSGVTGEPVIRKMNPNELPILTIGVEGIADRVAAARYVNDTVISLISTIPGVSSVDLVGAPERELAVELNVSRLNARGVTPLDVAQALSAANVEIPSGEARYGSSSVNLTSVSSFSSPTQAGNVVTGLRGNAAIRVSDVADVSVRETEPDRYILVNGEQGLLIDVLGQSGADTVKVIKEAKKRLAALEDTGETPLTFSFYRDQSVSIEASIRSVRDSAIQGGLLAVLVLYLFLGNIGPTLIIAISIPFTIVLTFTALFLGGHSLNTMTLGGLTGAIGMVVDASIVMLEGIWRRAAGGLDGKAASKAAGNEMGGAIIASTLTSVVVFAPLIFVSGITGIILRDIALTIIYALAGSVLAAIFVVPFLSALILGRKGAKPPLTPDSPEFASRRGPLGYVQRAINRLEGAYARLLDRSLGEAPFIIVVGLAILALSVSLIEVVGFEFMPETDTREIIVEMDIPTGFPVKKTLDIALIADGIIDGAVPEAERRVFYVGQSAAPKASPSVAHHAYGFITLTDQGRSSFGLVPIIREGLETKLPDVKVSVRNGGNSEKTAMALGGAGFRVDISGPDIEAVAETANVVAGILREDSEVESAELSITDDVLKLVNRINLDLAGSLGVSPSDASQTERVFFNGAQAGEYDDEGDKIPVMIRGAYGDSITADLFHSIPVRSRTGKIVSLSAFSSLSEERGVSEIPRTNKTPTIQVISQLSVGNFRGVQERLGSKLALLEFPEGTTWSVAGAASETTASFKSLIIALSIGIILVYAVMAIQFERYRQPLIVLSAIPFTLIGVTMAILIFGSSLSIISILGLIALAGIAVNNAIIMIDYTNLLRTRDGLPLREALVKGSSSRLRPILMTTLTTVLGVLPLAFATGGAATMAVLGQVLLFGLTTSTLITFFITPSLYWLTEKKGELREKNA